VLSKRIQPDTGSWVKFNRYAELNLLGCEHSLVVKINSLESIAWPKKLKKKKAASLKLQALTMDHGYSRMNLVY